MLGVGTEVLIFDVDTGNHSQQVPVTDENVPCLDGLHLKIWIIQRFPHFQRGTRNVVQNIALVNRVFRDRDRLSVHIQCAGNDPLSIFQAVRI